MTEPLFNTGSVVMTSTLKSVCERENIDDVGLVIHTLARHQSGDWGNIHPGDTGCNEDALKTGNRLFSVYNLDNESKTTFWVITEWDRSVTTFLLPEDY